MSEAVSSARPRWLAFVPWLLGFAVLSAPLLWCRTVGNLSTDERVFYLPAIRQIRDHWPRLNLLADSLSATSPGYPYFLSTVSLATGPSFFAMRAVNWLVSLGVLALLWGLLQRRGGGSLMLALLPLALDNFFVKSSCFVVTDNAALMMMSASLAAILFTPSDRGALLGAVSASACVAVRQINVWLAGPLLWRLWREAQISHRWGRLALGLIPVLPLAALFLAWHGLVPPAWAKETYSKMGFNGTALIYLLTVLFSMGASFYMVATTTRQWRDDFSSPVVLFAGALGLVLVLVSSTVPDFYYTTGRWGGYWWTLAAHLPVFGHISVPFLVLAPLGAAFALAIVRRLWLEAGMEPCLLWLAVVVPWTAAMLTNRLVFHRYYEPPLLLFLIYWLALLAAARTGFRLTRRWPLVALALVQLALTLLTVHAQAYGFFRSG